MVKTASNATAVQALKYQNNKWIVVRHFGSCHGNDELRELVAVAHEWVREFAGQLSIFPDQNRAMFFTLITALSRVFTIPCLRSDCDHSTANGLRQLATIAERAGNNENI